MRVPSECFYKASTDHSFSGLSSRITWL